MAPCCHCRRRKAETNRRGLCWTCYRDPAIRVGAALRLLERWRQKIADSNGQRPLSGPTDALPGSAEKVVVLCARALAGVQLFHPLDGQIDMNLVPSLLAPAWEIALPDGRRVAVRAHTRSEARAAAKRELGLRTKRCRLPLGTEVRRLPE